MKKENNKIIKILSAFIIVIGIIIIFISIPIFTLSHSIKRGGIWQLDKITIEKVFVNSPASGAHLQIGDKIISINNQPVQESEDFISYVDKFQGKRINITIERNHKIQKINLIPRLNPPKNQGRVGIVITNSKLIKKPLIILIPQVIVRGYLGYVEKEYGYFGIYFGSQPYYDKNLNNLKMLILGIFYIFVGSGLLKLKKYGLYGFMILAGYEVVVSIIYLLNPVSYQSWIYYLYIFWIILNTSIIYYLLRKKSIFK
jgi:membrane-associated protease RseP (regulator of RpoE activity)